jgi:hypothetical protein
MEQLVVVEKWFTRQAEGSATFTIDAELVKKAISFQESGDINSAYDWIDNLEEHHKQFGITFSAITMLNKLVQQGGEFGDVATENGLAVETEERLDSCSEKQLFGIGTTKAAAEAALRRLVA